ncbi:hypothetical protein E2C01_008220 [Portunus trituberculatus]|uniref:HMG box domain-containing protein n=1 Tax=Portunus trituberculatus TaxID=210409 RepID=A0A5B7D1S0_PORTR|nr:hypothetical protein [Portunus trituberculatus]
METWRQDTMSLTQILYNTTSTHRCPAGKAWEGPCCMECNAVMSLDAAVELESVTASIGRHSKSLDTNKKVCGYCLGKFELLVNSKTQKDQSKATPGTPACNPRTPKTPGPFALFVKENYGSIKKSTPNVKHGDVMKILSAKFEKMKTGAEQKYRSTSSYCGAGESETEAANTSTRSARDRGGEPANHRETAAFCPSPDKFKPRKFAKMDVVDNPTDLRLMIATQPTNY